MDALRIAYLPRHAGKQTGFMQEFVSYTLSPEVIAQRIGELDLLVVEPEATLKADLVAVMRQAAAHRLPIVLAVSDANDLSSDILSDSDMVEAIALIIASSSATALSEEDRADVLSRFYNASVRQPPAFNPAEIVEAVAKLCRERVGQRARLPAAAD